jgi:phosphatidylglycerol lysyltransferase
VAYAVRNAVAVACGGPLCAPADVEASARDFVAHCHKHGWSPCFYAVPDEDLPGLAAARLKSLRIGEEGLLDPRAMAPGAAAATDGRAPGASPLAVWRYDRAAGVDTVLDEQIVEVSDEWLAEREIGELHFTFGSFDLEELGSLPVFVCGRPGGRIEAFCTWLPYANGTALPLDLLRRRRGAPEGARETLLAGALAQVAASGVREVGLGLVPVAAEAGADAGPFGLAERLGSIYRYDDLFALKDRLAPRWEPRHLVYPGDADLPRVAVAVVDVHTTLHERSPIPRLIAAARALRRRAARERD